MVGDVRTGRRIAEAGKEFDQLMSADISPDHRRVVIGTNTKKVKCYDVTNGEELYLISKHTEWVTGADFSPDGILLATSDRNGNVMVWEADNGGEFFNLGQHQKSVTGLAWRADSNVLASCSADGTVSTWEMRLAETPSSWATLRRLMPRLSLASRRRGPMFSACTAPPSLMPAPRRGRGSRPWDLVW